MSRGWTTWLAWALWCLTLCLAAATSVVWSITDRPADAEQATVGEAIFAVVAFQAFSTVGALIATRHRRNAIGWLLLVGPILLWVGNASDAWGHFAVEHGLSGAALVTALAAPSWMTGVALVAIFGFLLFPDGRLLSARWRPVVVLGAVVLVLASVAMILSPGELDGPAGLVNPIGVRGMDAVLPVVTVALFAVLLLAVVSLVVRYRRAVGVERQQMKVVALTVCGVALVLAASGLVSELTDRAAEEWPFFDLIVFGAFLAIPVSIGVAILRYRLYEIDRVISRTLVYAALTVILGAAYAGLVLAGQAVFSSFAGGGDLAIAVSTLVVAALFLPVRSRVQGFVDRRFYRRRYDAQRTLEAFGARLRDEVDLGALSDELRGVVTETMQPAHASLWLRTGARA